MLAIILLIFISLILAGLILEEVARYPKIPDDIPGSSYAEIMNDET